MPQTPLFFSIMISGKILHNEVVLLSAVVVCIPSKTFSTKLKQVEILKQVIFESMFLKASVICCFCFYVYHLQSILA